MHKCKRTNTQTHTSTGANKRLPLSPPPLPPPPLPGLLFQREPLICNFFSLVVNVHMIVHVEPGPCIIHGALWFQSEVVTPCPGADRHACTSTLHLGHGLLILLRACGMHGGVCVFVCVGVCGSVLVSTVSFIYKRAHLLKLLTVFSCCCCLCAEC